MNKDTRVEECHLLTAAETRVTQNIYNRSYKLLCVCDKQPLPSGQSREKRPGSQSFRMKLCGRLLGTTPVGTHWARSVGCVQLSCGGVWAWAQRTKISWQSFTMWEPEQGSQPHTGICPGCVKGLVPLKILIHTVSRFGKATGKQQWPRSPISSMRTAIQPVVCLIDLSVPGKTPLREWTPLSVHRAAQSTSLANKKGCLVLSLFNFGGDAIGR